MYKEAYRVFTLYIICEKNFREKIEYSNTQTQYL